MTRVRLAEIFHWTFDYIDTLTEADVQEIFAVRAADAMITEERKGKA